jgi:hypothetical protein
MHLALKREAARPAGENVLQQQAKVDEFLEAYNTRRPLQALGLKFPGELYTPSPRPYRGLRDVSYRFCDRTLTVTNCGRICLARRKISFSKIFSGQDVGITEVADGIWLVSFMTCDLGYFYLEGKGLEPLDNPFGPRVL